MRQVEKRFATNPIRQQQFEGLVRASNALGIAGSETLWLDGSYITNKDEPGDFDATFDATNIDWIALGIEEPDLLDFDSPRSTQKRVYGGELLPLVDGGVDFVGFFQTDRDGKPKGVVRIDLKELL